MTNFLARWISLLILLVVLSACGGEPLPDAPEMEIASVGYVYYWPVILKSYHYDGRKAGVGIATQAPDVVIPTSARDVGATWYYNWSVYPELRGLPQQQGAEFVPMVWRGGQEVLDMPCGYGSPVFWLNEPNWPGQATMPPEEGANLLEQLLERCPTNRYIGPHMAPSDRHHGWPWAVEFYAEWERRHGTAPPTTLALHLYDHPRSFAQTITNYYAALSAWVNEDDPIWITEFNVPCGNRTSGQIAPLVAEAIEVLESDNRVERYAIFALHNGGRWSGLECGELVDAQGVITAVGRAYRDANRIKYTQEAYP